VNACGLMDLSTFQWKILYDGVRVVTICMKKKEKSINPQASRLIKNIENLLDFLFINPIYVYSQSTDYREYICDSSYTQSFSNSEYKISELNASESR